MCLISCFQYVAGCRAWCDGSTSVMLPRIEAATSKLANLQQVQDAFGNLDFAQVVHKAIDQIKVSWMSRVLIVI